MNFKGSNEDPKQLAINSPGLPLVQMPRGASTVCASKCAHFDVNKSECGYFTLFRKVKVMLLINGLKPTARQALLSKFPELLVYGYYFNDGVIKTFLYRTIKLMK